MENYLDFCQKNIRDIAYWNFELMSTKDIDTLLFGKQPNQSALLKHISESAKLINKQFYFISNISLYIANSGAVHHLFKNKHLTNSQFESIAFSHVNYIMHNDMKFSVLNKSKIDILLKLILVSITDKIENQCCFFDNLVFFQKLNFEQCNLILNKFSDERIVLNNLLSNPRILKKTKDKLFEQYKKRTVFK